MGLSSKSPGVGLIDDVFHLFLLLQLVMSLLGLTFILKTQNVAAETLVELLFT